MEEGDKIVSDFHKLLGEFTNNLTPNEIKFTKCLLNIYTPFIYGKNFDEYKKQNNIKDNPPQFGLIPSKRRGEKTLPLSVFCACVLCSVPGAKLVVYSPSRRQSVHFMGLICEHLKHVKCDYLIEDQLNLSVVVKGDIRKISTLPSKEGEGVRGENLITCLEANSMSKKFIREVTSLNRPVNFMYEPPANGWLNKLFEAYYPDGKEQLI